MSVLGRKAMTAVMAGLVGFGPMAGVVATAATPSVAFAVEYGTGSVTINQSSNAGATYDGYRIFKAVVKTEGGSDKATDVVWESSAMQTAVVAFLESGDNGATTPYATWLSENGHTGTNDKNIAQNAADYISAMITGSATAAGTNTTPKTTDAGSFANKFAKALLAANISPTVSAQATGTAYTGTQGYYLFVTTDSTIENNEAGTAPIYTAISNTAKTISEKSAIPTIDKKVVEDSTGQQGIAADADYNQPVHFVLTGTLPTDVKAFSSYYYKFTDTMTHLTMTSAQVDAATVKIDGNAVTNGVEKAFSNGVLTVTFADLFTTYPNLTKDSRIVVEYDATLTNDCTIGGTGNPNVVKLTYSSNPNVVGSRDDTNEKTTRVYTYALTMTKVDQDTREALSGAKFTIQVANDNSDTDSRGKYVQADGSLSTTAYEFTTNDSGQISVPRIDEGKYVIHETTPAADHEAWVSDVTLNITRSFDSTGAFTGLTATVSGGNGLFVSSPTANQDGVGTFTQSTGTIPLTASDRKIVTLPGTGLSTSAAGMIVGLTCVLGGMGLVVSRKKKSADTPAE